MTFSWLIPCSFFLASAAFAKAATSVTLAEVAGKVITTRDVQISSVMDHWFALRDQPQAAPKSKKAPAPQTVDYHSWFLDPKSDAFRRQVSTVMVEELVVVEAESFSVAKLSSAEVDGSVRGLTDGLKALPEWQALEIAPTELEAHVVRHLRAKEFMKFKAESMGLQVSDDAAKAYYEKNRVRFNNLPFENFKSSIKEYLTSLDVENKMKDWFDVLRKKYKVKILQFDSSNNG